MATATNGHARTFSDPILLRQVAQLMAQTRNGGNPTTNLGVPSRLLWQGGGREADPRRSLADEFG